MDNVRIYEKPTAGTTMIVVPFQVGPAREWLPGVVAQEVKKLTRIKSDCTSLLLHMGIADESTPPFLRGASDSITADELLVIMREHNITFAFAGNWHEPREWLFDPQTITQLGALVPTGFDNPGTDYGRVMILDTDQHSIKEVRLAGGPRFFNEVFEDLDLERFEEEMESFATYLRVTARPKHVKLAQAALGEMQKRGALVAFEVLPDKELASATAKSTARATRNTVSVEEAVATYVKKTVLPEGADRGAVLELVKGYLAQG
jgi:hypothetical protein